MDTPATRYLAESFLVGDTTDDDNSPEWTILVSHELLFEGQRKDETLRQKCAPNGNNECGIKKILKMAMPCAS